MTLKKDFKWRKHASIHSQGLALPHRSTRHNKSQDEVGAGQMRVRSKLIMHLQIFCMRRLVPKNNSRPIVHDANFYASCLSLLPVSSESHIRFLAVLLNLFQYQAPSGTSADDAGAQSDTFSILSSSLCVHRACVLFTLLSAGMSTLECSLELSLLPIKASCLCAVLSSKRGHVQTSRLFEASFPPILSCSHPVP